MYQKILVPLDGSELAECVLPHIEALGKGFQVENIIFVRVVEPVHLHVASVSYGGPAFTGEDAAKDAKN